MIAKEAKFQPTSPSGTGEIAAVRETLDLKTKDVDQESSLSVFAPQSLSGVFDEAFDLYKRHFGLLAMIAAIIYIPTQALAYAVSNLLYRPIAAQAALNSESDFASAFLTLILGFLIGAPQSGLPGYLPLLLSYIASGPVSKAVNSLVLGEISTVKQAYQHSVALLFRLFFAWGLFSLIVVALGVVSWVLIFFLYILVLLLMSTAGLATVAPEIAVFVLILLIVAPYFLITAFGAQFFAFVGPLMAIEKLGISGALIRSAQLVRKGLFSRTWMALSLLPLVIYGLQLLILQSSTSFANSLNLPSVAEFVLLTGFSNAVCFFFQPYWMIFLTLLYYDFRIRKEALDIRRMFAKTLDVAQTGGRG